MCSGQSLYGRSHYGSYVTEKNLPPAQIPYVSLLSLHGLLDASTQRYEPMRKFSQKFQIFACTPFVCRALIYRWNILQRTGRHSEIMSPFSLIKYQCRVGMPVWKWRQKNLILSPWSDEHWKAVVALHTRGVAVIRNGVPRLSCKYRHFLLSIAPFHIGAYPVTRTTSRWYWNAQSYTQLPMCRRKSVS